MKLPFARQDATPISRHLQAAVDRLAGRLGPAAEKVASVITRQRAVTWTLLLFGLTFIVWLPALSTFFYLDDFPWLRRYVTDPLPALEGVKEAFLPSTAAFTYRPTAFPFWRIGGLFFGEDPVGYHALNLLMIASSGALLTVIARQLKLSSFVAYAAGFIYVVHPALFSNAFWISTVNDNMANMFSLAAVAFALGAGKRSWLWFPGYLSFVLALLSKESAVVVPFILGGIYVIRWWTREEALTRRSWPALGFFALLLGFVVLRSLPQVGAPWSAGDPRYEQSLFGTHVIKNSLSYAILFWRPIVPQAEIFQERFLDIWNANPFGLLLGAALGMALLLLGVRALVKREQGVFLIGWAWLALGLLPAIPYTVRALDHYASLALVGFALLAAAAIALLAKPLRFAVLSIFLVLGVFYVYDRQDEHWVASGQALAENTATTLKQELPSTSEGMAIMLFWSEGGPNPALQALGGHNGPQVLYDDPDLVVFNGNGLSCKEGSLWAPEGRKGVDRPVDPENTATFLAGEEGVVSIPIEEVFPANLCQYQLLSAIPSATFDTMLGFAQLPGSDAEAVVITQAGQIWRVQIEGEGPPELFADLADRLNPNPGIEEGLLGLAFSPDFEGDSSVYLYYSAGDPRRSVLSRFKVAEGTLALASEEIILEIPQPHEYHNAGQLVFGLDSYLYVALGDGGGVGDPFENAQNLESLHGSILRIDVSGESGYTIPPDNPFLDTPGARPEIYAYGLRNPWRFSFDKATGDLWAADVGEGRWEEVNRIVAGANYGWNSMEGLTCFNASECDQGGLELPRAVYGHDEGCSVTGGYVYRGLSMLELNGWYVYGDFCTGRIWAVNTADDNPPVLLADTELPIVSFAELPDGELLVVTFANAIYRLGRAP